MEKRGYEGIKYRTWQRLEGCLNNCELIKFGWFQNRDTSSLIYFLSCNNPKAIDPEEPTTVVHQCVLGNVRSTPGCELCDGGVPSSAETGRQLVFLSGVG